MAQLGHIQEFYNLGANWQFFFVVRLCAPHTSSSTIILSLESEMKCIDGTLLIRGTMQVTM